MNRFFYTLTNLSILSLLFSGCVSNVFSPPKYPQDYWHKSGYSFQMIIEANKSCGTDTEENAICMINNGFNYLDPNKTCKEPRNNNKTACQSLEKYQDR